MKPSHRKENVSVLRKYGSFFRLRFAMGLQYRGAALGGIATQFAWGFLNILLFDAFYRADPAAFPMGFASLTSYLWLQQAFLALFMSLSLIHISLTGRACPSEISRRKRAGPSCWRCKSPRESG